MTKKPMRVIEGNAKPHDPFWVIRDAAETESGETEIEFFGPISEFSWFGDEITPKLFKDQLNEKGAGNPVRLLIHSPGGDVFAASVIRSVIQDYVGKVTADIVGLAASAATIVIQGADKILMRESATMMIHDPSSLVWGTIDEIKKMLDILKTVKSGIIDTYQTRTGLEPEKLAKMMTDETWMTAREAKDLGFVDEVVTGPSVKQALPAFSSYLNVYEHAPAALLEETPPSIPSQPSVGEGSDEGNDETNVPPELEPSGQPDTDAGEREVAELRDYLHIFG
jgi:ATP-dependent Clp protease protease subunit